MRREARVAMAMVVGLATAAWGWRTYGHPWGQVLPRAAADLNCPPDQVHVLVAPSVRDEAWPEGCGRTAHYRWTWGQGWQGGVHDNRITD